MLRRDKESPPPLCYGGKVHSSRRCSYAKQPLAREVSRATLYFKIGEYNEFHKRDRKAEILHRTM